METLRVLIVEDRLEEAHLLVSKLRKACEGVGPELDIEVADTLADAQRALSGVIHDVILLDLGLPDSQGIDTMRAVATAGAPIVIHSGLGDRDVSVLCIQEGAQDFVSKNHQSGEDILRALLFAVIRAEREPATSARYMRFARRVAELI